MEALLNISGTTLKEASDIALVALLAYGVLVWLRRTKAQLAVVGISILGAAYLLAHHAGLVLTAWALLGSVVVAVVLWVVAFQADLRRAVERLALPVLGSRGSAAPAGVGELLAKTAFELAGARRGALVVLPGREPIDRHVDGGIALGGVASGALLASLFDPHSPGHDGAVVVEGNQVTRFAVHLPLAANLAQDGARGTRHAAALGLAERTDALVIVVSEERGLVSVAHAGRLREIGASDELAGLVRDFADRVGRTAASRELDWVWLRRSAREIGLAIAISLALWAALVPGSAVTETVIRVGVSVRDLPPGYALEKVRPEEVEVTVSGPRRTLFLAGPEDFELQLDAILVRLGRRSFDVGPADVKHPRGVAVVAIQPSRIVLTVQEAAAPAPPLETVPPPPSP